MAALDEKHVGEKQEPVFGDVEGLDSDGDVSITALVLAGKNPYCSYCTQKDREHRLRKTIADIFNLLDHQHEIKLRIMSWQKAAWLLAGDQVCLAIMAQTWSLS